MLSNITLSIVLSFDIGIKNLAYCLMNDNKIIDWSNVNIDPTEIKKYFCKVCGKKAKFYEENTFYCKRHITRQLLFENEKISISKIKKIIPIRFKTKQEYIDYLEKHYALPIKKDIVKKMTFEELFTNVNNLIKNKWSCCFSKAKVILIENQPTLKNPRMKTIQILVYTLLRLYAERDNIKPFPSYSLVNPKKVKNSTYLERKKINEERALEYITEHNMKWIDFFNNTTKKSDLADALVMILQYKD
jgi:hypothetical protein